MAKENNNIIILLAVLAAVLAFVALISVFYPIVIYTAGLTGLVTGEANLTIAYETVINISNGSVEWGEGRVTGGMSAAALNTSAGTVTNGNWTAVKTGFIIMNKGNVNVSVTLASGDGGAAPFMGGTNPQYEWNASNYLAGSCGDAAGILGKFFAVNATTGTNETKVCGAMNYLTGKNMMEIDFSVVIPEDAAGDLSAGAAGRRKQDTITITATAAI